MRLLVGLFLMFPSYIFSQKIVVDEIDKFTHARRVESNFANVRQQMSCVLQFKLRAVDTSLFLSLRGVNCGAGVVGNQDYIMFLFADNSTVKVFSTGIQDYEITTGGFGTDKHYTHQYFITKDDIVKLKTLSVTSVRITHDNNYADFDLKEKYQHNVKELASNFCETLDKKKDTAAN